MPAPQALKDEVLRLLDEAYETDATATSRVSVVADEFVPYDETDVSAISEKQYKTVVDCTDPEHIRIRIRPVTLPLAWPF